MCTLAVYVRTFTEFPLILAANRDEFFSRPSLPPDVIDASAKIFGGRDGLHGGTWLGVNSHGVVAALLNRRSRNPPDPSRRSRGLLCVDALRFSGAAAARSVITEADAGFYNPFNLLVADRALTWVATNHEGRLARKDLSPGLHLLTNLDVDDPECPRIAASYQMFAELLHHPKPSPKNPGFVARLREILSTHDAALDPRDPVSGNSLCLHLEGYGTCSSTLIFLDAVGQWTYLHTDLPPCRGDYRSQVLLFQP